LPAAAAAAQACLRGMDSCPADSCHVMAMAGWHGTVDEGRRRLLLAC